MEEEHRSTYRVLGSQDPAQVSVVDLRVWDHHKGSAARMQTSVHLAQRRGDDLGAAVRSPTAQLYGVRLDKSVSDDRTRRAGGSAREMCLLRCGMDHLN